MKVRKEKTEIKDITDMSLMVESTSQQEILEYDEDKIIKSLKIEVGCSENTAKEVAEEVTDKIKTLELNTITTSLIRSFVNTVLYEKGINKKLKSDTTINLPIYDIKSIIENKNKENANTVHNPESINLSIAERVLKEYALREIFPKEVAKNHLEGKIHIHDMGMPQRAYAFDGDKNKINIKNKNTGKIKKVTFTELWNFINTETEKIDSKAKRKYIDNLEVEDVNSWTDINYLVQIHEKKDIYEIELEDGESIYVTDDHTCIRINENNEEEFVETNQLKIGDVFYVKSI